MSEDLDTTLEFPAKEEMVDRRVSDQKKMNSNKKRRMKTEETIKKKSLKTRRVVNYSSTSDSETSAILIEKNVMQKSTTENISKYSSIGVGRKLFEWLLNPIKDERFFSKYWERTILYIKREKPNYFSGLVSIKKIDTILRQNNIQFTKNIEITSHENGISTIHNPEGRAFTPVVWDFYNNGCSITLFNPQAYLNQLYSLDSTLQEYFQCKIETNLYLTPPNTQRFSPHYDGNESFVLQIEGKNSWKVYAPREKKEQLPRHSSSNLKQIGKPISEVVLEPGDILYIPRGFIYQATTLDNHSLHITLNVYQKNSWADLMEEIVPAALTRAIQKDEEFRQGLPLNIGTYMGLMFSEQPSEQRTQILKKVRTLFNKLFENAVIDDGIDQIFKKFQHTALPPDITETDRQTTIHGCNIVTNDAGKIKIPFVIELDISLRLIRANCLRLVRESDSLRIYFSVNNSLDYKEIEQEFIEIGFCDAPILEFLVTHYPNYSTISDIPVRDEKRKLVIVKDLWEKGLLMTKDPIH